MPEQRRPGYKYSAEERGAAGRAFIDSSNIKRHSPKLSIAAHRRSSFFLLYAEAELPIETDARTGMSSLRAASGRRGGSSSSRAPCGLTHAKPERQPRGADGTEDWMGRPGKCTVG